VSTERSVLEVRGVRVDVVRKNIANLHLGVYPPDGHVRVSAPLAVSDEAVRLAVIAKLAWIRRQRVGFVRQPRQTPREAVAGESHYYLGRRYRLKVVATDKRPQVLLRTKTILELHVPPNASESQRLQVLDRWYREQLREVASPLIAKWESILGVSPSYFGIKRMKTKWGSCNHESKRVWINSELAKKPLECLDYIIAHELVHLLIPRHGDRFVEQMDNVMPNWRSRREFLNDSPLAHEEWNS
jgi:predicted metal-dependent hydrolase